MNTKIEFQISGGKYLWIKRTVPLVKCKSLNIKLCSHKRNRKCQSVGGFRAVFQFTCLGNRLVPFRDALEENVRRHATGPWKVKNGWACPG